MEPNLEFPNPVFNPIQRKSCIMQVALLQENEVHPKKFFLAPKRGRNAIKYKKMLALVSASGSNGLQYIPLTLSVTSPSLPLTSLLL